MRRTLPSTMALQCFEAASRNESFSQAARSLNLTQGAISRQIRLLEELVEQPLFERQRQRVKLTAAGHLYLKEILPVLQNLEASTLKLRSFQSLGGGLNIGCYPTLGTRWLLNYLLRFANEVPEISTNTITYLDNEHFDASVIDIGIVQELPPWLGSRADWLMAEDLIAVASPSLVPEPKNNPLDLLQYRLLNHVTRPRSWQIWFETQGYKSQNLPVGLFFPQYEMVIEATVAGYGVSILPLILVQKELADGRLCQVQKHIARTDSAYYLLTPLGKESIPKINVFRDWLLGELSVKA
ncbi:MAG: LysR family glycine cleavage system transcriptional activator [Gammaproteobacteria bacterium]|jgi:LysR family glycine cleavage system transcriptional activator